MELFTATTGLLDKVSSSLRLYLLGFIIHFLPNLDVNSKLCLGERSGLYFATSNWEPIVSNAFEIES